MKEEWLKRKQEIEQLYGKWLSYEIVGEGDSFYLNETGLLGNPNIFFERILTCVKDLLKKPLNKSSILDLGCLEGKASLLFANEEAGKVVGIDGREGNIAKAEFAKETFGLKNVFFKTGDVREVDFGAESFDVVLALGLLYHLEAPAIFNVIEKIFKWTKEITVIDTHIAIFPQLEHDFKGQLYSGFNYKEFIPNITSESSIGNEVSFWLTRWSLYNMLLTAGYTGIYECRYPRGGWRERDDRITLIATKQPRQSSSLFRFQETKSPERFKERDPREITIHMENSKVEKR